MATKKTALDTIMIRGARVHNLKNVDVDIPRNKLVVITGLSGSGKSSLAFDTLYAEGQRRYVESLSAYARQFLGLMDKPDVDRIDGLSPAISIDQKSTSHNPRSTVGTVTEIYDYLRLLYARVGVPHCPKCGDKITGQTVSQITDAISAWPTDTKIMLLSPLIKDKKGEHKKIFDDIQKWGYVRVRVDGTIMDLEEARQLDLDKFKKHDVEVVVDRIIVAPENRQRLADSLETALDLGHGVITVINADTKEEKFFSEHFTCPRDGISLPEIQPRTFSFNSPHGACPACTGLGTKLEVDIALVIPNPRLSLAEGAIRPWTKTTSRMTWYYDMLESVSKQYKFSMNAPVSKLSAQALDIILHGTKGESVNVATTSHKDYVTDFEGVVPNLERRYRESDSDYLRQEIEQYMRITQCPACSGKRLRPESLSVLVDNKNIAAVTAYPVDASQGFFAQLDKKFSGKENIIAHNILKEIRARLQFLQDVGLQYITLDRNADTLSGGEAQRIRLATQIGSGLTGVLYILDEPSIGLHQRDNDRLLKTLKQLRDLGNTIIVVEHDEETMKMADWIIDVGPGAGRYGGVIVGEGTIKDIEKNKQSLTGQYLTGAKQVAVPKKRRKGNGKHIVIRGAQEFNLKNIDATIPLGKLVAITGVSGSGKSTLMNEILAKSLSQTFYNSKARPGKHKQIDGVENIDKVIDIDQSPIGRTPRSNPATYTGVFTAVRDLFANTKEARTRGYKVGRFSFNVKGGRCEVCAGDGMIKIEMHFLPDVYVTCDECKGKRYNKEALQILYKGKNIAEILAMTIDEAKEFLRNVPKIHHKLEILSTVGLGYVQLGQSATTLSGGEAQRVKLATELARQSTGRTLYILDEPTTGLHFDDVSRLLNVLNQLVDKGNTVLVIEHNLDVLKASDWLVDLGPEGGNKGGEIVAEGTPEQVAKVKRSHTGEWLKKVLK